MARIIFWEKPGCMGAARQKALLRASGHVLEVRNLLAEGWTPATLRPFFEGRPVAEWFNASAPAVKAGTVDPGAMDAAAALAAMCADPVLIRRPLMAAEGRRMSGFRQAEVAAWLGLTLPEEEVTDVCPQME